ncbi:5-carboxymethyl-2-hydroxymuconate Delta-isomerase [Faucicola boevrei]|uniref:5-carboxymethyl-2-hydroxymuconate Delta-isomerase n=1 Tax=Faucicola boevrei TaxID=346665 RepID=UPI0003760BDB|nr:5-carboxymethyl-2-hydroxymuconate Delta-isomerase [Moraxella boevrei]
MPHIIIETSQNIQLRQADTLLKKINENLWQTGEFDKSIAIKSRIYKSAHSLIGIQPSEDSFIAVQFCLMSGRDEATKAKLVQQIFDSIVHHVKHVEQINTAEKLQVTINTTELSPQYFKQSI